MRQGGVTPIIALRLFLPPLVLVFLASSSLSLYTKGKEKREESVAYHRQRAALGRLHEKHNLVNLERERRRTVERYKARGQRMRLSAREGDETSKAKIRMSVGMLLGCVYRVIQQSREDREEHARERTRG